MSDCPTGITSQVIAPQAIDPWATTLQVIARLLYGRLVYEELPRYTPVGCVTGGYYTGNYFTCDYTTYLATGAGDIELNCMMESIQLYEIISKKIC